jgi:predicted Zn finger-like uncharacterized protein
MSLVTRCTACGTVFRVVQDQLKVSSGWVRCGRCGEVFNALQTLFDLDRDAAPVPGTPPPPPPGSTAATVPSSTPVPAGVQPMPSGPPATGFGALDDRWRTLSRQQAPARTVPEPAVDDRDIAGAPPFATSAPSPGEFQASLLPPDSAIDDDERFRPSGRDDGGSVWPEGGTSRWIEPDAETGRSSAGASDSRQLMLVGAGTAEGDVSQLQPEFLREHRRRSRWTSPLARGLLGFAALALGLVLLFQIALHERDRVADFWPWTRPLLVQACRVGGCEVGEAPRHIEAFTVESTTLTKAGAGNDTYRLTITLRNRGERSALLPSIELALTDAEGQLVARRALHPADFRVQRPVVAPGADTTLQLLMSAGRGRVNGYTIEIFYP